MLIVSILRNQFYGAVTEEATLKSEVRSPKFEVRSSKSHSQVKAKIRQCDHCRSVRSLLNILFDFELRTSNFGLILRTSAPPWK
jgi:hypothetical protein